MDNVIVSIIKGAIFVKYDDNNLLYIIIIIGCGMSLARIWCIAIIGNNTDNNEIASSMDYDSTKYLI